MKVVNIYVFTIILSICLFSCHSSNKKTTQKIVKEWLGKKVIFPKDVPCSFNGQDTIWTDKSTKPYKILFYADSTGCTTCKLKLFEWKTLISEVDSNFKNEVDFLFYFQPKNENDIKYLLKSYLFKHPVFLDPENKINKINHFPDQHKYQCFLLDHDNEVILIGNPTFGYKLWALYKEKIKKQPQPSTSK